MLRPLADTMPAVTVSCSPTGLPMASPQAPTPKRARADGACFWAPLTTLASEELIKEILERSVFIAVALILIRIGTDGAPPVRVLDGRLGIDVHHARLKLLGNLGESVRELLRSGNRKRSRIRRLLSLFAFHSRGDNRANQNSNGERRQNGKSIGPTIGLETSPKSAFARIHFFPPENYPIFYYTFDTGRGRAEDRLIVRRRKPSSRYRNFPWRRGKPHKR